MQNFFRKVFHRLSGRESKRLYELLLYAHNELRERDDLMLTLNSKAEGLIENPEKPFVDTERANYISDPMNEAIKILIGTNAEFLEKAQLNPLSRELATSFRLNGSDKSTRHSYELAYSMLLQGIEAPKILEIGIGSNSTFPYAGIDQVPGGSLKAWRAVFPHATIVGGDIDASNFESISEACFWVDQNSNESLMQFKSRVETYGPFDLIVDDGLHEPDANIRTFQVLKELLSSSGNYVIEDVHGSTSIFWKLVGNLYGRGYVLDLSELRNNVDDNILFVY